MLTQQEALAALCYSPDTGELNWLVQRGRVVPGQRAGAFDHRGYLIVRIFGRIYKAHRVAWLMVHGSWPKGQIDHINGMKSDNRLCNLRDVSALINSQNQHKAQTRNRSSGLRGVTLDRFTGKWKAQLRFAGRNYQIGRFNSPEEAHHAYVTKKNALLKDAA